MDNLTILKGVSQKDRSYLFDTKLEKELEEICKEKERLNNEIKKYDQISGILERLPHELGWPLPLLPVTRHALLPGAILTNTNEVQVHIGDGWFTRCSTFHARGICKRRQDRCQETKKALEEREKLLREWLRVAQGRVGIAGGHEEDAEEEEFDLSHAFNPNEIEEFVSEEDYFAEKERHKERVRENYLKQRALAKQNDSLQSDEELWSRLEELEIEEASQGELRVSADSSAQDSPDTKVPELKNPILSEIRDPHEDNVVKLGWSWDDESFSSESESNGEVEKERPRKLSFADHIETGSDETSVIEFSHTPVDSKPEPLKAGPKVCQEIQSPSDFYSTFEELFAAAPHTPKSILKRRSVDNANKAVDMDFPSFQYLPEREILESESNSPEFETYQPKQVLMDIVEKQPTAVEPQEEEKVKEKKVSMFKAARQAKSRKK